MSCAVLSFVIANCSLTWGLPEADAGVSEQDRVTQHDAPLIRQEPHQDSSDGQHDQHPVDQKPPSLPITSIRHFPICPFLISHLFIRHLLIVHCYAYPPQYLTSAPTMAIKIVAIAMPANRVHVGESGAAAADGSADAVGLAGLSVSVGGRGVGGGGVGVAVSVTVGIGRGVVVGVDVAMGSGVSVGISVGGGVSVGSGVAVGVRG